MDWQTINIALSAFATIISVLMMLFSWRRRNEIGVMWFTGLIACVAWITFCYIFEAAGGANVNIYITFSKLEYIGLWFVPVFWLGFALHFSGRERTYSNTLFAPLTIIPFITVALAFTNEWHGLIWEVPRFVMIEGQPVFQPDYGVWFWVNMIYSYIVFFVGSMILLRRAFGLWRLYRLQAGMVLVGTALPWVSNLLQIFDSLNPLPYLYLNAFFLLWAILFLAFAVFRLRMFDIVPLAYDTILNNVPNGIVVVDEQNRIVAVNVNVVPFLAHPEQDPIGRSLREVFPGHTVLIDKLEGQYDYKGEMTLDDRVVEFHISPVLNWRKQRRGRVFVFTNVTMRARMEQAMTARNAELEQLYQRVSQLEQLKTDMIRVAAHDIRNPLSVVIGYLELLSNPNGAGAQLDLKKTYEAALKNALRADQLAGDLLSLERIERMAQNLTSEPFDLGESVSIAVEEFEMQAEEKGLEVHTDIMDDGECWVNGDSVQLYEAVTNFISNAIKYTPKGGRIDVSLTCDGVCARLEVRDTGYGIPEAQQVRMFQAFFRAKTEETRSIEGSGLGLYLTKNIIERQGGKLIFHSVHGKGSTFGFTMPLLHHPISQA